tara:strand:- start:1702 stop:1944 length:243 start_codon:yes stop_codon:yes gene_type:complete
MPLYDFKNLETEEIETKMMSISDMEKYVKDPNIQQVITAPKVLTAKDGQVLKKAGDGWKEVQQRIQKGLPPRLRGNINTK